MSRLVKVEVAPGDWRKMTPEEAAKYKGRPKRETASRRAPARRGEVAIGNRVVRKVPGEDGKPPPEA